MFSSATDAIKGEGLQEGVDWLQGMGLDIHKWKCADYSAECLGQVSTNIPYEFIDD